MGISKFSKALLVVSFSAFSSMASAAFIGTLPGNDCPGFFGQPFASCTIPANIDPTNETPETPIIIKFNIGGETEINSALFPTIDGSEFTLNFTGEGNTGTWTYNPGDGDPEINFFSAKGGPDFNLFSTLAPDSPTSGTWFTPGNGAFGLSHISFWDTDGGGQVPAPTTLLLLGAGLVAAAFARRRVKRD